MTTKQSRPGADWNILAPYFSIPAWLRDVKPAKPAYQKAIDATNRTALAQARRLAKKHAFTIEREGPGAYWVAIELDAHDDDPLAGGHFCSDGVEVLDAARIAAA